MSEYKAQGWRMAGYYPDQYAKSMSALGIGIDYSDDDHDRYEGEFLDDLDAHDAKTKADLLEGLVNLIEAEWSDPSTLKEGLQGLAAIWQQEATRD